MYNCTNFISVYWQIWDLFKKNVPVSGEVGSGRNLLHGLPVWLSSGEFKG